jgi:hypothetical protein
MNEKCDACEKEFPVEELEFWDVTGHSDPPDYTPPPDRGAQFAWFCKQCVSDGGDMFRAWIKSGFLDIPEP